MAKKAKFNLRATIEEICDKIDAVDADYGEARTAFKWNGDTVFILRQIDLGNGYASADVYQLNPAAQQLLVDFLDDEYCGPCDEVYTDDVWVHLESHKLIEFSGD